MIFDLCRTAGELNHLRLEPVSSQSSAPAPEPVESVPEETIPDAENSATMRVSHLSPTNEEATMGRGRRKGLLLLDMRNLHLLLALFHRVLKHLERLPPTRQRRFLWA